MVDKKNEKPPLCPRCINWDPRPEEGLGTRTAYCTARDIITSYRTECEYFEESNPQKRQERNRQIYGEFQEEGGMDEG